MSLEQKVQDLKTMLSNPRMEVFRRELNGQIDYITMFKGKFNPKSHGIKKSKYTKVTDLELEKLHLGYITDGPELAEAKPKRTRRTKKQIEDDKK